MTDTDTPATTTNPTVDPDPTCPRTIYDVKAASVDNDPDFTGTLTISGSFRDDEGRHHTVVFRFPAADVPTIMREVVNHGGLLLSAVATAWMRGDCATCNNTRMIQEDRPGRGAWSVHCPDCDPDTDRIGRRNGLSGFPVIRKRGDGQS